MKSNRYEIINISRGIGAISIIIGHICNPIMGETVRKLRDPNNS